MQVLAGGVDVNGLQGEELLQNLTREKVFATEEKCPSFVGFLVDLALRVERDRISPKMRGGDGKS